MKAPVPDPPAPADSGEDDGGPSGASLARLVRATAEAGASVRFRARGVSMSPFIRDGDVVTLIPRPARLRRGDVAAFLHPADERLTVHRVIGIERGAYRMRGDNAPRDDGLVPPASVLGRVTRVERDGRDVALGLRWERRLVAALGRLGLLRGAVRWARPAARRTVKGKRRG